MSREFTTIMLLWTKHRILMRCVLSEYECWTINSLLSRNNGEGTSKRSSPSGILTLVAKSWNKNPSESFVRRVSKNYPFVIVHIAEFAGPTKPWDWDA